MYRAFPMPQCQPLRPNLQTYTLDARCPTCRHVPALRITEGERTAAHAQDAAEVKVTYRCHYGGCRTVYEITARAYQCAHLSGRAA